MTEAWKRRKLQKAERTKNWYYSCTAVMWWGDSVDHETFHYTEGGKQKMRAWLDEYLEADWRVSVKLVRKR